MRHNTVFSFTWISIELHLQRKGLASLLFFLPLENIVLKGSFKTETKQNYCKQNIRGPNKNSSFEEFTAEMKRSNVSCIATSKKNATGSASASSNISCWVGLKHKLSGHLTKVTYHCIFHKQMLAFCISHKTDEWKSTNWLK